MQYLSINTSQLEMKKPPDDAPFNKDLAETIAESIKEDGLIHAPVVTPSSKEGKYEVISGRHRIYAAGEILGWPAIECKVLDAEEAKYLEQIRLAENLFKGSLNKEQRAKNLIRWHDIYTQRHPESDGTGAAKKLGADTPGVKDLAPKTFKRAVEEALDVSSSTADRLVRVAKNLKEEDVTVLSAANATEATVNEVAALGESQAIEHAVKLIGSGMNPQEAIRQAEKMKKPKNAAQPKGERPAKLPAQKFKPKELTDEDWIASFCASTMSSLRHRASYKNDAILYRRIQEKLIAFRGQVSKALVEMKSKDNHNGTFFANLYRLIHCSHPTHWMVCGICTGTGKKEGGDNKSCVKCLGAGYVMRMED